MKHDPAPTFEQPFEMLEACHERVQRMLDLLHRLREHLARHGADDQARQAARDVMRYFDLAAPQHHLDEERHVFPPLLAGADVQVAEVVSRLQREHREMEVLWANGRQLLQAVSEGQLCALDPTQSAQLEAFATLYARHIETEESVAYPVARTSLDEASLARMSEDMMRRRGVSP